MKAILLLVSLLVLSSVASAQITQDENNQPQDGEHGWVQIPTGTSTAFFATVAATPSGTVWVGSLERMLRSKSPGEPFIEVGTPTKGLIRFYDDSNGIVARDANTVFLTTNGGNTWVAGNSTEVQALQQLAYASSTNVFAVGVGGVSKSTNSGKTWFKRQLDASDLICIHFADSLHGFIGGAHPSGADYGLIFRTKDGGESWQKFHTPPFEWHGVFAKSYDTVFLASLDGYLLRSTDRGETWKEVLFTEKGWGIRTLTFINSLEGFASGGRNKIYYTSDAGSAWTLQQVPTNSLMQSFSFFGDSVVFAAGGDGVLLKTTTKSLVENQPRKNDIAIRVFPEPVNDNLSFTYSLPEAQKISLSFYTADGKIQAKVLNSAPQSPGQQNIRVNTIGWTSGTYVYHLESDRFSGTGRIIVVH